MKLTIQIQSGGRVSDVIWKIREGGNYVRGHCVLYLKHPRPHAVTWKHPSIGASLIIASSAKLCFVDQFSVHHKLVSKYCEVIYITHMTPSPPPSVSHTVPDSEQRITWISRPHVPCLFRCLAPGTRENCIILNITRSEFRDSWHLEWGPSSPKWIGQLRKSWNKCSANGHQKDQTPTSWYYDQDLNGLLEMLNPSWELWLKWILWGVWHNDLASLLHFASCVAINCYKVLW